MEAIIKKVTFLKEFETNFGKLYSFKIEYDNKVAFYNSKSKDQIKFKEGEKALFVEEEKEGKEGKKYLTIKPEMKGGGFSGFNKAVKKEQSKYSGFAVSYVKDLIVADKIDIKQWEPASKRIFEFMVALDKTIAND